MIEALNILVKLQQSKEAMMKLYKEEYPAKVGYYKKFLSGWCSKNKKPVLESLIEVMQLEDIESNGMAQSMFICAAIDLINSTTKD